LKTSKSHEVNGHAREESLTNVALVAALEVCDFAERRLLCELRQRLAEEPAEERRRGQRDSPNESVAAVILSRPPALTALVAQLGGGESSEGQLPAAQVIANISSPLAEEEATRLARAAGPRLVATLTGGSGRMREAAATALGNLALSGRRAVRVLVNQDAPEMLALAADSLSATESERSACLTALYNVLHSSHDSPPDQAVLADFAERYGSALGPRCQADIPWLTFALSCNESLHPTLLAAGDGDVVSRAMDILTYEIFQKADPLPLVKAVTPALRLLANLCAGPRSEEACLSVLTHPDLPATLVALLGTNYSHLAKESLLWFASVVNSESLSVQETLVDTEIMDKMEFFTAQAIQRLDPYLTNVIQ